MRSDELKSLDTLKPKKSESETRDLCSYCPVGCFSCGIIIKYHKIIIESFIYVNDIHNYIVLLSLQSWIQVQGLIYNTG